MRYLSLPELLEIHRRLLIQTGGSGGMRDLGGLLSALAQPQMTFGGDDLYRTLEEKATALCYSLVMNHPFLDGNKRIGHAAMETFPVLNGYELRATIEDAEEVMLDLAAGRMNRDQLLCRVEDHIEHRA